MGQISVKMQGQFSVAINSHLDLNLSLVRGDDACVGCSEGDLRLARSEIPQQKRYAAATGPIRNGFDEKRRGGPRVAGADPRRLRGNRCALCMPKR